MTQTGLRHWFENFCRWNTQHHQEHVLREGISQGWLNEQDIYGMTALSLAIMWDWNEGVHVLLKASANPELRYHRTGETALYMAVQSRKEAFLVALLQARANPEAANFWGVTPRQLAVKFGLSQHFQSVSVQAMTWPEWRIQNAEHLADHYHPHFKIPDRRERESLQVGQAVDLYVYGPRSNDKQDTVKVRITSRSGQGAKRRYTANVETPIERTHLPPESTLLKFGPENIATVYVPLTGKNSAPERPEK